MKRFGDVDMAGKLNNSDLWANSAIHHAKQCTICFEGV